jgi:putative membrane protein
MHILLKITALFIQAISRHTMHMNSDTNASESETRTKWAEDRTILANERTYSSWMGTGLACVGVAIGLKAIFGAFDPTWVAKLVASLFLGIAIMIYWMARRQACKTLNRLSENDAEALPTRDFTKLSVAMTIATVGTGIVLWLL